MLVPSKRSDSYPGKRQRFHCSRDMPESKILIQYTDEYIYNLCQ